MSSSILNTTGYNVSALNVTAPSSSSVPTSLLTFDGYDCNDGVTIEVQDILFNSGHRRDIDKFAIPRANGMRIANVNDREKMVTVIGRIKAADADAMETLIDTVKKNLRGKRKQLVTVWGGKTRLYEHATLTNPEEIFAGRRYYHIDMVPFKLEFLCEDYSTNWEYDQWTDEITAAEDTIVASGDGTVEGKPVIVVVFSAASGVTSLTVEIDENGQQIGYSGSISAGDAFVFDCENEQVTLNGVEVDFTGYFPVMPLETNTFRFTTNGASRTFRVTVKSKHAYL